MNKGLWVAIGFLVLAIAWLLSVKLLYKPDDLMDTNTAMVDANAKLVIDLDEFKGFHHDAQLLLEKLSVLKMGLESAIVNKDTKLFASTVNNTYRTMDSINSNRLPTIAPFEVCDEALDSLGLYAVAAKSYYSDTKKTTTDQIDAIKNTFETQFVQCQTIVNDKSVEALYQDYQ